MSSNPQDVTETVEKALTSLQAGIVNADVHAAVSASKDALNHDTGIDESQKKIVTGATTVALENASDDNSKEKSNQIDFLLALLSVFAWYLQAQQEQLNAQQKQNTQPNWTVIVAEMAKWFLATQNSINISTGKADVLHGVLQNESILRKHGLQQENKNTAVLNEFFKSKLPNLSLPAGYKAIYTGSTITRRTNDGSSPYTAYYTPDGNTRITGDFKEGFKDILNLYKEAGADIRHANITGKPLNNPDAYDVINIGVNVGVTPILEDRDILGSAELFAKEGATRNPDGYKVDTEKYLQQIAANSDVRDRLINEMVDSNLGEREALKQMDPQALAGKAFEQVMAQVEPKAEATAETKKEAAAEVKRETQPMQNPASAAQPQNPVGDTHMLTASAAMNGVQIDKSEAEKKSVRPLASSGSNSKKEDDDSAPRLGTM